MLVINKKTDDNMYFILMSIIGAGFITSLIFKRRDQVKELALQGTIKSLGFYIKVETFIQSIFFTNKLQTEQDTIYIRLDGTETKSQDINIAFLLKPEKESNNVLRLNMNRSSASSTSSSNETIVKSNVSFLAVQLKTLPDGGIYNIVLNTPEINLMTVGNVLLDKPFIKWYLRRWHHFTIKDDALYEISFIDPRMNYIRLNQDGVLIEEDDYKIL